MSIYIVWLVIIISDRKEDLKALGIPQKLGILAYGERGTGKSSTILATATYMDCDVFYIDLNGVTKNSELRELFNTVQKENVNGGLIVFEDIDVMTSMVHKREGNYYDDNLSKQNEDDLNLSYFLNLLDGTLCAEGSKVFITTNKLDILDPAIYRSGRIDVLLEFKLCNRYQIKNICTRILKKTPSEELLSRIPEDKFLPADVIFKCIEYLYRDEPLEVVLSDFM